jgi:C1A family cysteine protease
MKKSKASYNYIDYTMWTAFFAAFTVLSSHGNSSGFWNWVHEHGKTYDSMHELEFRQTVWEANVRRIEQHNSKSVGWRMEVNKFADLTPYEFQAQYISGGFQEAEFQRRQYARFSNFVWKNNATLPSSVDWTSQGAVTPVKNQGQCGSCWAFSTTGSLEGAYFLSNGTLFSLSEQQLVDCSASTGNQGCNGGLMDDAFSYIHANGGITSESNYPYTATDGICDTTKEHENVASLTSYTDVPANSDSALMNALARQPVSVAVEADQNSFQFYSSGVMTAVCGTNLDHGVLAVGYGSDAGQDFYKVKNSWGADWGEEGYIRLGRGGTYNGGAGQCGILSAASYPNV